MSPQTPDAAQHRRHPHGACFWHVARGVRALAVVLVLPLVVLAGVTALIGIVALSAMGRVRAQALTPGGAVPAPVVLLDAAPAGEASLGRAA